MPKLGLRVKFFLYSNTLIVVTMTLVTLLALVHEKNTRYEAIERRGRSISEAMAISIADTLRYQKLGLLEESGIIEGYISRIQAHNRDLVRYVAVSDLQGMVTHSNDESLLGLFLEAHAGPDDGNILEFRTALESGAEAWGELTVGFSLEPIERQVKIIAKRAALVAILLMIGNSALTAAYVETLIRPILGLNRTMKRAARGDLTVRARSRAGSEVGELADAFNRMMDDLEEANERDKARHVQLAHTERMAAVGTLAAGVAHEVNNPLSGILTCIENMRADIENRETLERYLDLIHDGLKRIERTVANLLDFSRQRKMFLEPTSINHNLRHVAELVDFQLRKGQVEVLFDLDDDEPYVMADHFQMEQLFLNLVLNALQAMPQGGKLHLTTRCREGNVMAEIRDTGVGIPFEIRERIFHPFFTTREVDEGTGLGLAVSDSIVAAHGGALEVESMVGKGSAFRVSFPMLSRLTDTENA